MAQKDLDALRTEIDVIDDEILGLLNRRMSISREVGILKAAEGQSVFDSVREAQILRRLASLNPGPLLQTTLEALYREIFSGSRALQTPLTVAYLGPQGTFTHEAALQRFGHSASLIQCSTVTEIFDEIEQEGVSFGVVPVENSIEGSVRETLDLLMTRSIGVCGEISLRISHSLLSLTGNLDDIRTVASHPQALAQCRKWLTGRLPGIPFQETTSTARAAEIASTDKTVAAVGSERLAVKLGLQIIRKGIQEKTENFTRFSILGSVRPPATGTDKTSLIFWTEDRPGALYKILQTFAEHEINLSRIESRPDRGAMAWKYAFFVDIEGHREDDKIIACLDKISGRMTKIKILGSYPVSNSLTY